MLRLPRYDKAVLGGFVYVQPQTGYRFDGNAMWKNQLRAIRAHRIGNNLPRQSLEEIADDLEAYTCARLPRACGNHQHISQASASPHVVQRRVGGCAGCGGRKRK